MGGTTLCVVRSMAAWCSAAGIAGGVQAGTGEMDINWGKADVTEGCSTACATHNMVSCALCSKAAKLPAPMTALKS